MPVYDAIKGGDLRHFITIFRQVTKDGTGRPLTDESGGAVGWVAIYTDVPAKVEPRSSRDSLRLGQGITSMEVPIEMRWLPDIKPNMRVKWEDENFIIQGIIDEGKRHRKLTLMCVALGNQP